MARQTATATATALGSLTADTWYTLQNKGSRSVWVEENTAAPSNGDSAFVLSSGQTMMVKRTGATQIYIWQTAIPSGAFTSVVYNVGE
ncbi:MAG: hypothetical protein ISN29_02095 [Gammaproteobacteria bacterium AqS3]|nr:hypothetical protein [Gammaproteobacteria bacterium AqS3]